MPRKGFKARTENTKAMSVQIFMFIRSRFEFIYWILSSWCPKTKMKKTTTIFKRSKSIYWTFAPFMRTNLFWNWARNKTYFNRCQFTFCLELQLLNFITFYASLQLKSSTPFTCFPFVCIVIIIIFDGVWSCIITRNVHKTFQETERCAFIFLLKCHRFLLKFVNFKEKFLFHTYITSSMKRFQHAFSRFFSVLFIYIHRLIAEPRTKQWNEVTTNPF